MWQAGLINDEYLIACRVIPDTLPILAVDYHVCSLRFESDDPLVSPINRHLGSGSFRKPVTEERAYHFSNILGT